MSAVNPLSVRLPLNTLFVPVPVVCFTGALVTDIVYWQSAAMQWANISAWLLVVGLIFSALSIVAGIIDFFSDRRLRAVRSALIQAVGTAAALILSLFNAFIHSRDAYTSVVPTGLLLSAAVVAVLLITSWSCRRARESA